MDPAIFVFGGNHEVNTVNEGLAGDGRPLFDFKAIQAFCYVIE